MLGKLIKHEWKSVYKINCIMVGAVLLMTALGCLAISFIPITDIFENSYLFEEEPIFAFITMMSMIASFIVYVLTLMGAVYGVMIYSGVHFYKTMYTDEGYLTHTLPVKPHQILISKTLVAGIWYGLVIVAMVVSIFSLIFFMREAVMGTVPDINRVDFWNVMKEAFSELQKEMGVQTIHLILVVVLVMLLGPFYSMMMLFGAITIGQMSKKHKILMSILSYIGVSAVAGLISFIAQIVIMMCYRVTGNEISTGYMLAEYDVALFQAVIMGAALYFISHYIISRKLNLD